MPLPDTTDANLRPEGVLVADQFDGDGSDRGGAGLHSAGIDYLVVVMPADVPLSLGPTTIGIDFTKTGTDALSTTGTAKLSLGQTVTATAQVIIQSMYFSLSGEGLNIARDRGQPVTTDYQPPFPLNGATLDHVTITTRDDVIMDHRETEAAYRRD
jgi:arylsulfatase